MGHRDGAELDALYSSHPEVELNALRRGLRQIRRQGFAVNNQATEAGVTAVGRAVFGPGGVPIGGLSVAMPTARYRRARLPEWVSELARTSTGIEADLVTMAQDWPPQLATSR